MGLEPAAYGELVLGNPENFCGQISDFSGTGSDTTHSDSIDLKGINYSVPGHFSETYCAVTGVLTVTDGVHSVHLTFDGFDGTFSFASDGKGGTIITDPALVAPPAASTSTETGFGGPTGVNGSMQIALSTTPTLLGADHVTVPPAMDSAGSASSFLSEAIANSDQGQSLGSDQNGHLTKTSLLGDDHAIDLSTAGGVQTKLSVTDASVFGGDHAIVAAAVASVLGGDQVIVQPVNTSGLNDHAIAPPVNTSGLNEHAVVPPVDTLVHGAIIVPPVTGAAGNAASFLSGANTNSDQGPSPGGDQNGLLTKTFLLGNDHAIDLSGSGGAQTKFLEADTPALGGDHVIVPLAVTSGLAGDQVIVPPVNTSGLNDHAVGPPINTSGLGADHTIVPPVTDAAGNASSFLSAASTDSDQGLSLDSDQNGSLTKTSSQWNDHAAGPANETAFGSDQVSAATATSHDGDAAPPANELALGGDTVTAPPPATSALGGSDLAAFGSDQVAVPSAGPTPGGALSAVTIQSGVESPIAVVAPGTPVLDSEHLTDSTIVDGSGVANSEVTPTAPANEHAVAPTLATSPTPATSPTLASASLGAWGNDSFAFHPNLGSDTAQSTDAHTSELAHSAVQIGGAAPGSIAPEFHQEFAFDAIHQDAAALAATVDQFHQMAASSTLLH